MAACRCQVSREISGSQEQNGRRNSYSYCHDTARGRGGFGLEALQDFVSPFSMLTLIVQEEINDRLTLQLGTMQPILLSVALHRRLRRLSP